MAAPEFHAGDQFGKYRLTLPLGRGGFGEVWRATNLLPAAAGDAPEAAIKILSPRTAARLTPDELADLYRRFLTGARTMAEVPHERLVKVREVGRRDADGVIYLVSDYLAGGDLAGYLRAHAPQGLPELHALRLLWPVVRAIAACHAHERRILHRDLKPTNLLLDTAQPPRAFVTDFDTVVALDDHSRAMTEIGTPVFTAPEVWAHRGATPASDVYSLGKILSWLLTGRSPSSAEKALHLPGVSQVTADAIATAIRVDPTERFADAGELLAALGGAHRGGDISETIHLTAAEAAAGATRHLPAGDLAIPAGVTDGHQFKVAGWGRAGEAGAPAGDLLVTITIEPAPLVRASAPSAPRDWLPHPVAIAPWSVLVGLYGLKVLSDQPLNGLWLLGVVAAGVGGSLLPIRRPSRMPVDATATTRPSSFADEVGDALRWLLVFALATAMQLAGCMITRSGQATLTRLLGLAVFGLAVVMLSEITRALRRRRMSRG